MTLYDEIDLEDMTFNASTNSYTYQCPCGDLFQISVAALRAGEEIAECPSCTLVIRVVYDPDELTHPEKATVKCFEMEL